MDWIIHPTSASRNFPESSKNLHTGSRSGSMRALCARYSGRHYSKVQVMDDETGLIELTRNSWRLTIWSRTTYYHHNSKGFSLGPEMSGLYLNWKRLRAGWRG